MAKPKFSGIGIVDLQKSVANRTYARNSYGTYAKQKIGAPTPNANLSAWQDAYAFLYYEWSVTMTDDERKAWNNVYIPKKDLVCNHHTSNGWKAFVYCNSGILLTGRPPIYTPPPSWNAPPQPPQGSFDVLTASDIILQMFSSSPVSTLFYFTGNLPPTRMTFTHIYKFLKYFDTPDVILDPYSEFVVRYGAPIPGQKIFWKAINVDITTGFRSAATYGVGIVS